MPLRERWGIHTAASCHKGLVCSFRSIRSKPDPKVCGPDDVQLNILGLRTAKELAKRFAGELQDKITTCYAPMWLVCYRGSVITVCQSYKCMQHKRLHWYCQCRRYTSPTVSIRHQIYKENTLSVPEVLCCKPQWISSKSFFFQTFNPLITSRLPRQLNLDFTSTFGAFWALVMHPFLRSVQVHFGTECSQCQTWQTRAKRMWNVHIHVLSWFEYSGQMLYGFRSSMEW